MGGTQARDVVLGDHWPSADSPAGGSCASPPRSTWVSETAQSKTRERERCSRFTPSRIRRRGGCRLPLKQPASFLARLSEGSPLGSDCAFKVCESNTFLSLVKCAHV